MFSEFLLVYCKIYSFGVTDEKLRFKEGVKPTFRRLHLLLASDCSADVTPVKCISYTVIAVRLF